MSTLDDFFGVGLLGTDPYAAQKSAQLTRMQQLDQLLNPQMRPSPGQPQQPMRLGSGAPLSYQQVGANQLQRVPGLPAGAVQGPTLSSGLGLPVSRPTGGGFQLPAGSFNPAMSSIANFFTNQGTGGTYQPMAKPSAPAPAAGGASPYASVLQNFLASLSSPAKKPPAAGDPLTEGAVQGPTLGSGQAVDPNSNNFKATGNTIPTAKSHGSGSGLSTTDYYNVIWPILQSRPGGTIADLDELWSELEDHIPGIVRFGSNNQKIRLPNGQEIDLVLSGGAGGRGWTWERIGTGSSGGGGTGGPGLGSGEPGGLPEDLVDLRAAISGFFLENLGNTNLPFPGDLSIARTPESIAAAQMAAAAAGIQLPPGVDPTVALDWLNAGWDPLYQIGNGIDPLSQLAAGRTTNASTAWDVFGQPANNLAQGAYDTFSAFAQPALSTLSHAVSPLDTVISSLTNMINAGGAPVTQGQEWLPSSQILNMLNSGAPQTQGQQYLDSAGAAAQRLATSTGGRSMAGDSWMDAAVGPLSSLLQNGGMPDITEALNAIKTRGMMDIDQKLAGLREQFGSYGLSQGSDVNAALAGGASAGIADIVKQQSELTAQMMSEAQNRRLAAVDTAGRSATVSNAPFESAADRQLQGQLQAVPQLLDVTAATRAPYESAAQRQLAAIPLSLQAGEFARDPYEDALARNMQAMPSLLGASSGYNQLAQTGLQFGQAASNVNLQQADLLRMLGLDAANVNLGQASSYSNLIGNQLNATSQLPGYSAGALNAANAQYQSNYQNAANQQSVGLDIAQLLNAISGQETARQGNNLQNIWTDWLSTQQPQYLNQATAYATNNPLLPGPTGGGGGPDWGAIAGAAAMAAAMAFSDRNLKEDITPVKAGSTLKALAKLPIATWKYKGDSTTHLGPMAQDTQKILGIGDGKTIHLVDAMGIMFSAMKDLATLTKGWAHA